MKEMQKIRERLAAFKARSAWDKGVKGIAECLLDKYEEIVRYREGSDPVPPLTEKTVLNGANSWEQYCYDGCAMIYDREIAKTLCTPSELRRTDYGCKAPNLRETWMDVQVRAHAQAWALIKRCMR
jgi:hypothetical protein